MREKNLKASESALVNEDAVREALASVTQSEVFQNSPTLVAFLEHIVNVTLDGRAKSIKGYSIAVEVLGRAPDFNPDKDAVVRVHASRMRQALADYYDTEGASDPVVISVPKGGYVPSFVYRTPPAETEAKTPTAAIPQAAPTDASSTDPDSAYAPAARFASISKASVSEAAFLPNRRASMLVTLSLAVVVIAMALGFLLSQTFGSAEDPPAVNTLTIVPVQEQEGTESGRRLARALTVDLINASKRGGFLSVVLAEPQPEIGWQAVVDTAQTLRTRFVLTGMLLPMHEGENDRRLVLSLIEGVTGFTVWHKRYVIGDLSGDGDYDDLLQTIAFDLEPAYFQSAAEVIKRADPARISSPGLFLLSTWQPGSTVSSLEQERARIALARQALARDGTDGLAHSVLAEKMSYLALVDPPSDTPEAREAAATHADRALTFAGQKANAVFNIARQRIHAGRVEDGGRGLRRAARLDPGSAVAVFLSEHWRHQCTATPPVEIRQAIAFHSGLNAHHPARWVSAAAIAEMHLNNGDFTRAEHWARDARERSQALTVTYTLAAALAQQGKDMEARKIIEQQRRRWPNLDLHHYADAAIPRLCAGAENQDYLQGIYRDLADDLSAAQENRDKLPK